MQNSKKKAKSGAERFIDKLEQTRKMAIHQLRRQNRMNTGQCGSVPDRNWNRKLEPEAPDQCRITRTKSEGKQKSGITFGLRLATNNAVVEIPDAAGKWQQTLRK